MAKAKKNTWVRWSEEEVKLLRRLFPKGRAREIAERTGRPLKAVRQKAYTLGLKTREWRRWSDSEVKLLKKLHPNATLQSIADKLGRSLDVVGNKALKLGLRKETHVPWTIQEETLLKKLYADNSTKDVAKQVGRSVTVVRDKASKLGAKKYYKKHPKKYHAWSKKELNLLKKLYPTRTAQEIAEQIGRPVRAVRMRIVKLGLKKRKRKTKS
jgi:hypothetical protein